MGRSGRERNGGYRRPIRRNRTPASGVVCQPPPGLRLRNEPDSRQARDISSHHEQPKKDRTAYASRRSPYDCRYRIETIDEFRGLTGSFFGADWGQIPSPDHSADQRSADWRAVNRGSMSCSSISPRARGSWRSHRTLRRGGGSTSGSMRNRDSGNPCRPTDRRRDAPSAGHKPEVGKRGPATVRENKPGGVCRRSGRVQTPVVSAVTGRVGKLYSILSKPGLKSGWTRETLQIQMLLRVLQTGMEFA
jgi:hypothetical protein